MSTPMFDQYHSLKAAHPQALLLFRMGDFYECFFEDAKVVARELDLTLTARNKKDPNPIPMAGVPHHAVAGYIQRLVDKGHRVAIAEQMEDPRKAKGLVKRDVVRVVTPGVVLDPTALDGRRPNYIVAICGGGIAFADLSTGDFRISALNLHGALGELHRIEPREALLSPDVVEEKPILAALRRHGAVISQVEPEGWQHAVALREVCEALSVHDLTGFGVPNEHPGIPAAGALVRYARDVTRTGVRNLHELRAYQPDGYMVLDDTTRRNLELTKTLIGGRRKGTLLHLLDRTATPMGGRLLREWLAFPLLDLDRIRARHAAVGELVNAAPLLRDLRNAMRQVSDIERIGARVVQQTAHARDLAALRDSLGAVPEVVALAKQLPTLEPHLPTDNCGDIFKDLDNWLVDEPPISLTEGGLLKRGMHEELDEVLTMALEGMSVIAELEASERKKSGIQSLKIRRNKVFGYYIEVTRAHLHKVPEDRYLRKQTLSNAERYITVELKELEEKVLGADERRKELEYELFVDLRDRVGDATRRLLGLARRLASLDVLCGLGDVATLHNWVRPAVDDGLALTVHGGRHPVVEALLDEERFVPNDVNLDVETRQLIVLTGPNMSGKSTIMRQVALIVLLAQIGSFVPADDATIGVCDRIFTRVGAADDLARGQSTFMVEMSETSAILHNATRRSLVILDEIGRGTSTYDGLSIAWAVAEDLVDRIGCRALFATHYHELCELVETRDRVVNQSIAVSEWGERIVFLRRLKEGGASRSYGIQCAKLAGLPAHVVTRATSLLTQFEKHAPRNERHQLSLFGQGGAPNDEEEPIEAVDLLRDQLRRVDPDELTPRRALELVYELLSHIDT
jgi:DNA mismatch repair protein MutS